MSLCPLDLLFTYQVMISSASVDHIWSFHAPAPHHRLPATCLLAQQIIRPSPLPAAQVLIASFLLLGCDEISNQLENPFRHLPLMDFIRSSTGDIKQ